MPVIHDFFLLLIASLAVFRLSEMVVFDNGPWHIFKKIRAIFPQDSKLDELVECIYCMSIWMALIMTAYLAWVELIPWRLYPLWCSGIAGGAIVIYRSIHSRK